MTRETAHTPTHEQLQAGRDAAVRMWTECGEECESLKRQRDALVAALEELCAVHKASKTREGCRNDLFEAAWKQARAALKVAKP
jgi:hypothetical protein